MKRRNALKKVAASVGGLLTLPAWASHWSPESLRTLAPSVYLSKTEIDLLAEIAETVLPATRSDAPPRTEVPGAKALDVHRFIEKMLSDCYPPAAQEAFRQGLTGVDNTAQVVMGKPFLEGDARQRLDVLKQMSDWGDATEKNFVSLVKNLTIQGYMSSEYVMTTFTHFEMAPARYRGCVPVKK